MPREREAASISTEAGDTFRKGRESPKECVPGMGWTIARQQPDFLFP